MDFKWVHVLESGKMEIIASLLVPWLTSEAGDVSSLHLSCSPGRPLYGSLMTAWQSFFTSAERLSALHSSISQSLVAEEGVRVKSWQRETFPKKLFCGFRESYDNNTSFSRVQKPWNKKLTKVSNIIVCIILAVREKKGPHTKVRKWSKLHEI